MLNAQGNGRPIGSLWRRLPTGTTSSASAARLLVYLLAGLAAIAPALARYDPARAITDGWREPLQQALQQAEVALTSGHPREAQQAWEQAFRVAIQTRTAEALLDVGRAYIPIGEAVHDRSTAVARARRLFLMSLFRARDRHDGLGVAGAAAAFAALGDREVADRGFDLAIAVATRYGDEAALVRIGALRARGHG